MEKLQDVKTLFSVFAHLIQFEATDGLDDGGPRYLGFEQV